MFLFLCKISIIRYISSSRNKLNLFSFIGFIIKLEVFSWEEDFTESHVRRGREFIKVSEWHKSCQNVKIFFKLARLGLTWIEILGQRRYQSHWPTQSDGLWHYQVLSLNYPCGSVTHYTYYSYLQPSNQQKQTLSLYPPTSGDRKTRCQVNPNIPT